MKSLCVHIYECACEKCVGGWVGEKNMCVCMCEKCVYKKRVREKCVLVFACV